jgi:hypothetical protein
MLRYLTPAPGWLVAFGFATLVVSAQDSVDYFRSGAPTAAQRELVQQLGDPSYNVRDEAARQLASQGAAVINVLTEALADPDPEIRTRARSILHGLLHDEPAADAAERRTMPEPTAAQRKLVQQLGDASFFVREEASRQLISQGAAAKAALIEAFANPDVEVRNRARRILKRILHEEFEARLAAFVADVGGNRQHRLPGWQRFKDLVGDGRDARTLFAAMMRSEQSLLSAYENQTEELGELFAARVTWLQSRLASGATGAESIPPAVMATLLLIGSDPTLQEHSQKFVQLYQLLYFPSTKQAIAAGSHREILLALLEKWVATAASTGSQYGIMIALKYDLEKAGLQQARHLIEHGTTSPSLLQYAIICVGRFGSEQHIELLKPLLDNKTVCHTWSNAQLKKDGNIKIQVRDVALVVTLRLLGKDPDRFGFNLLRESPETLYYVYTFGFINDDEREAAHAKWAREKTGGDS